MTRSLPHYHTIAKTFQGVLGVGIWKTPYFAANLKIINTCPILWGVITSMVFGKSKKKDFIVFWIIIGLIFLVGLMLQ